MENQPRITVNPIILVALFVQIIFIIVAIVSIKQILESNQPTLEVNIAGISQEIPELPERGKEEIEHYIYLAISNNSPSNNVSKSGIYIRDGSLIDQYYKNANMHYVSFIADIPEAKQSYRVAYEWSDDLNSRFVSKATDVAITCLNEDELIYGNFDCNRDNDYKKQTLVMMAIEASKLESTDDNKIMMDVESYNNPSAFKIKIYYALCDSMCICKKSSEEGEQQALNTYNDFIKGLGYEPDDFTHYFYNCENESMYLTEENNLIKTP